LPRVYKMADEDDKSPQKVIDWDEAMEQCGDDEEFLRELLVDLKAELNAQMTKIDAAMVSIVSYITDVRIFGPINPFYFLQSIHTEPSSPTEYQKRSTCYKGVSWKPHVRGTPTGLSRIRNDSKESPKR